MELLADLIDRCRRWLVYDAETQFYYKHFPSLVDNAELVLRPMERGDLKFVAAIENVAHAFPWEFETLQSCFRVGYHCWVGERARKVVCFGISTIGAGESHILNVAVLPEYQGCGYGRVVMQKLIEEATRFRVESIFLEVRPSNQRAIRLYHNMGFNEIGSRKDYYPAPNNGREDALVMARVP